MVAYYIEDGEVAAGCAMSKIPGHLESPEKAREDLDGVSALIVQAVVTGLKSRRFYKLYILALLLVYGTVFYYFEELARFLSLQPQYIELFSEVRDNARLYFLVPAVLCSGQGWLLLWPSSLALSSFRAISSSCPSQIIPLRLPSLSRYRAWLAVSPRFSAAGSGRPVRLDVSNLEVARPPPRVIL